MLKGFAFSGYRSIGEELIKISPLQKINFIIGQNNSGKSNIITFLYNHYNNIVNTIKTKNPYDKFDEIDFYITPDSKSINIRLIAFPLNTTNEEFNEFISSMIGHLKDQNPRVYAMVEPILIKIFTVSLPVDSDGIFWLTYANSERKGRYELEKQFSQILKSSIQQNDWYQLWGALTGKNGGKF